VATTTAAAAPQATDPTQAAVDSPAAPSTEKVALNAGTKTPAKTVVSSAGPAADTTASAPDNAKSAPDTTSASTADSGTKDAVKPDPAAAKDSWEAPAPTKPTKQSGDGEGQGKGPNSSRAASGGGGTDAGASQHRKPGHDAGSPSGGSKGSSSSGGSG